MRNVDSTIGLRFSKHEIFILLKLMVFVNLVPMAFCLFAFLRFLIFLMLLMIRLHKYQNKKDKKPWERGWVFVILYHGV